VFSLGVVHLSGHFPLIGDTVPKGELSLLSCDEDLGCGLVQLSMDFPQTILYGIQYGYRSGLNPSMVEHLGKKIKKILRLWSPAENDLILDIGSNDGTSLSFYPNHFKKLFGIDPLGEKYSEFYPKHVNRISDFFNENLALRSLSGEKAKIITSFSMLYDLPNPVEFFRSIRTSLREDGIWISEQSYLPAMLEKNSFDTICHEHLEYYSLSTLVWLCKKANLRMIDCEFNDVNGGSLSFTAVPDSSPLEQSEDFKTALDAEVRAAEGAIVEFAKFRVEVEKAKSNLLKLLVNLKLQGTPVAGLGASTKGNVLLEWMEIGPNLLPVIGDVNPDKWGRSTPGTGIPIISEAELINKNFQHFVVLPWHFRNFFIDKFKGSGMTLIFPLPSLEVITV